MLELFRHLFALPPGASTFADGIDWLHFVVIGTTLLGSLFVAAVAAVFIVRYRQRNGLESTPRVTASRWNEGLIIAAILSLFVGFWVFGYRQFLQMQQRPPGATLVYVVAKQWMWKFSYPNGQSSTDVLVIPQGQPVQLVMTSRDVIHSFFVPAFRVKRDVLPGRYVSQWFQATRAGRYPIRCAEYCGVSHSGMLGEVRVLSAADYAAWLDAPGREPSRGPSLAALGREAAVRHGCLSCHTVDGQRHIGPSFSRLYGATIELSNGQHLEADVAYLTRSMMDPAAEVVAGFPAVMPTYLGSLPQPEVAAIVEYIRSLKDGPIDPSVLLPRLEVEAAGGAATTAEEKP